MTHGSLSVSISVDISEDLAVLLAYSSALDITENCFILAVNCGIVQFSTIYLKGHFFLLGAACETDSKSLFWSINNRSNHIL